jgi:polysaccharide pyruvyl transferase WcaK-like protein
MIGDVAGLTDYHLGDEAMLEANIAALRRLHPQLRFTVFSRDPEWTSVRYGVDAIETPRFPPGLTAEAVDAVADGHGLVISGGGNLCGSWPEKIEERVSLIEAARALGRPVVITGQTIGPVLTDRQRERLAGALGWASWVGVRDVTSEALAWQLGVPSRRLHRHLDDAFYMAPEPVEDGRADSLGPGTRPLVVVTLDGSFGVPARRDALHALAGQLDALADRLGAALVFSPHVGGANVSASHSDLVSGQALAACLRTPLQMLGLWQAREVRWLIGRVALVVSSRYHPLVFAMAAGTPALGIHQDDYTRIKLRGAMAWAGLEDWCLSLADAEHGALLARALDLWQARAAVRQSLLELAAAGRAAETARWIGICNALQLAPVATVSG